MKIDTYSMHHLVKSEDLNHHGTLFAGRSAEWFVEAGFIAAASIANPENIVCLKVHGLTFRQPVRKGSLIHYESKVIYAGRTSLVIYIKMLLNHNKEFVLDGFITFIHVDENGRPLPHNITLDIDTPEDKQLHETAKKLR